MFSSYFLQHVHGTLEDPKTLTHHKLIHAATERVLTDTKTIADENLKDKGRHCLCGMFLNSSKHAFIMLEYI